MRISPPSSRYVVTTGPLGAVVVVVDAGTVVDVVLVVVVVVLVLGVATVVVGVGTSVVGGAPVVDDSVTTVVVVASSAVPALGMAGTSVTWPRTDPTAVEAINIATTVAASHATTIPTRRIMSILWLARPKPWITVR